MCCSAETIARRLKRHPEVQAVRFPGLEDDPSHNLACAQMQRFGFLIGLTLGSEAEGGRFHPELRSDPASHLIRRRSHFRRAPRPLGRRGRARVCPTVGRLRAGGGTLDGDRGVAGLGSLANQRRSQPLRWIARYFSRSYKNCQPACKPGSVWPSRLAARERGGHSSWAHVAMRLTQPTRTVGRKQP